MKSIFGLLLISFIVVATATPSSAFDLTAQTGATIKVLGLVTANPDCTPADPATIRITTPPQNGQAWVNRGTGYGRFASGSVAAGCTGRKLPSTILHYKSSPGFVGYDSMTVDIFTKNGGHAQVFYSLNVK